MSDSVRPHRWHPTRLPCPWDSPDKNTGVGCHFFSNAWKWKVKVRSLSRVWLLATPWTAAHQVPPSMGFSRQEHWSGLPFPSPMHESEKWKWSHSVMSDSLCPHGLQPTRLLCPWDFPGKSTGVGCHCFLRDKSRTNTKTKGFPDVSVVKNLLAKQEMRIRSLGWEDPLEKEMATHSSILAWRIPWTEESGGLQFTGS